MGQLQTGMVQTLFIILIINAEILLYSCCSEYKDTIVSGDALLLRTRAEDMVLVLHTNLLGSMLTCRAALKSMLHTKDAAIVNIGYIRTDMTAGVSEARLRSVPLGRCGEPEEVARAVLFLLESPYVTGQVLVVDGGLQLVM
uniref:3-ketoacyl-[acyl-carrier-protein] reductase beta subunit n=1 Tax=Knipowitschia caucasica TaxID=637954 RepID=A0AAV2L0Y2_KNICA